MCKAGEGVLANGQDLWFAPGSIATSAGVYLGIAWKVGVVSADGQVHCLAVGRKAAGTFLVFAVKFSFCRFGLFPFPFVVFLGEEDVGTFCSGYAVYFFAFCVVSCRGKIERVVAVVAKQGRAEVAPSAG